MGDIPPQLADSLRDRYALERELGRGGIATVYLARDLKHKRYVALKVLRPDLAANSGLGFIPGIVQFLAYDPGPTPRSVGETLKASRHRAGLSQERFARLLGVDPGSLSRWERGTRQPSQALLDRLDALLRPLFPERLP